MPTPITHLCFAFALCGLQRYCITVLVDDLVLTVVVYVIALLGLTSVSQRTAGALTVCVSMVGLIHLTVRLVTWLSIMFILIHTAPQFSHVFAIIFFICINHFLHHRSLILCPCFYPD